MRYRKLICKIVFDHSQLIRCKHWRGKENWSIKWWWNALYECKLYEKSKLVSSVKWLQKDYISYAITNIFNCCFNIYEYVKVSRYRGTDQQFSIIRHIYKRQRNFGKPVCLFSWSTKFHKNVCLKCVEWGFWNYLANNNMKLTEYSLKKESNITKLYISASVCSICE